MQRGQDGGPHYWPNSFGGPAPDSTKGEPAFAVTGTAARTPNPHPNDGFRPAGVLYSRAATMEDGDHLISNTAGHLMAAQQRIRLRQTELF